MSHSCENLLIHCMDFRLARKISDWAESTFGNLNYDLVCLAGAQKSLLDELSKETVLKQIDISSRLHGITTVNLLAHEDCGAYGGSKTLGEWEIEKGTYAENLSGAEAVIKEKFPLQVRKFIIRLSGEIEEIK